MLHPILCNLVTGQALYLQVFLTLYWAKREISKVCLQIIFGYGSDTGLLAWVRENTRRYVKIRVGKCFVSEQDRVVNLNILISCNMYLRNAREKKWELSLWGYIKSNKNDSRFANNEP